MKTYWKILLTVLPLVLFFLFLSVGTTYYYSTKALTSLAETWLETRLAQASTIAEEQMEILHRYGLDAVPASIEKAKMDAGAAIASIEVGELGFVFVVNTQGVVALHPDEDMKGRDVSGEAWFAEIMRGERELVHWGQDNANMAMVAYFEPWEWFLLATSPEKEIYGVANKMKPYVFYLAIIGSIAMSIALMFLTRELTTPLMLLTAGADRIGKGDLKTRISIPGRDEFSHLADVFNQMAAELQTMLTTLQRSHQELELRVQERTVQLKSINKELKEFAYVVSHDLKAPLRAISQLTHWVSDDYAEVLDREGRDMMELILKRVKRMDGLIDGVLSYSRIGRIKEQAKVLDLNKLVGELIENAMAPPHIHVRIDGELPVVQRDPIRMEQVFQNLIDNAVTYMDKQEGIVKIGCVDEETRWQFSVSDNGPGIERQYDEKIFQIFQTLAPRDEHESSGVGLTLVKKIIEQYDGSIWVESEPGKGATFYFTIPKRENEHATA
ncbi:MAG: ATP-binding protein [Deltaproteobacteria bacterium]